MDDNRAPVKFGGSSHVVLGRRGTPLERFFNKVKAEPFGCWRWLGSRHGKGYGLFTDEAGNTVRAHRWYWVRTRGAIPEGMQLDHLCRNRWCVNPAHLEPVTPSENVRRGYVARGAA